MISHYVNISINGAEESKGTIKAFAKGISSSEATKVASEGVAELIRRRFKVLHRLRHRGKTKKSYYMGAADAVVAKTGPGEGEGKVEIDHVGLALRYYGDTTYPSGRISRITGKPIRRLAIPRSGGPGEGKAPSEFKGALKLIITKRKKAYLAMADDEKSTPVYWLVKQAEHTPDPSVLPEQESLTNAATGAVNMFIKELADE